jgi:hypothetical protein
VGIAAEKGLRVQLQKEERRYMDFNIIEKAVAKQFKKMTATGLYRTDADKDALYATYLGSFPEGTNPIYKERTEHDCQCCRSFIRTVGGVVSIVNGEIITIWDITIDEPGYQAVADALAKLVKSFAIDNFFLHTEPIAGTANSRQLLDDSTVKTWSHFFVNLPTAVVVKKDEIGPKSSDTRATHDVMLRSLQEITLDSIDTVLELISQNSLYRGEEHTFALTEFRKLKVEFDKIGGVTSDASFIKGRDLFVWSRMKVVPQSVSRMRSTVIGTLLTDLSDGVDMEDAVKMFESKVAPTNYKRTTALVTAGMIKKAQDKVNELGFGTALKRRHANINDVTINNVLFADRKAKKAMNVFDEMSQSVPENLKKLDKVEEVSIEDFLSKILPKADSLELMVENRHTGNFVSLIAPDDPTSKIMFKWPNNFSWNYAGEVTDSIKERVKAKGGNVTGDLCCRLAWSNTDDLDFHMKEPDGHEIMYTNRRVKSRCGGELDLDANGADGMVSDPVENIFYANRRTMKEGTYTLFVHQFSKRESANPGFEAELDYLGTVHHFVYPKAVSQGQDIVVAKFKYTHSNGIEIIQSLPSTQASKTVWGIPTQTFIKVSVVMLSPNYWDDKSVLNKHYFFMLDGCLSEGRVRGFFNEFLVDSLTPHRKVFEMVGAKMVVEPTDHQLSGLGFSSTQRNHILCRVKGSFSRTVKILF